MPPPSSGRLPAVAPPTGGYPAVRPTGGYPAARRPSSGGAPIPQPSGQGRVLPESDLGPVGRARPPKVGEEFHGYRIRQLLGQGNMGRIYRARDTMGRNVALKIILKEVASEEGLARFEREGQAMAAIPRHRHVVSVHSSGTIRGMPYLVLDFVQGETLEEVLRRGPLTAEQAALVAEKLARAVDHVHQAGVLHRDLKPANVLIRSEDGEPVLTDFGLAGLRGADSLTQTGDLLGTPLYMAPEQVMGLHKEVDGRTDVWALAVLLYEMASGEAPFKGKTMVEVSQAITGKDPVPLTKVCPTADPSLAGIISRALTKDKEFRTPSPGAFASALRAWRRARKDGTEPPPPPAPPLKRRALQVGGGVVALVALVVGLLVWRSGAEPVATEAGEQPQGAKPVERQTPPEQRALNVALAALKTGALQEALTALEGEGVRTALQTQDDMLPSVMLARAQTVRLGVAACEAGVSERVGQSLALAALLNGMLPGRPAGPQLADAVIRWVHSHEKEKDFPLARASVDRLNRVARAGLRPSQATALEFLDGVFYARIAMVLPPIDATLRKPYYQLLLALARLEIDLRGSHLDRTGRSVAFSRSEDPVEEYLQHRLRISGLVSRGSSEKGVVRRRREAIYALSRFLKSPRGAKERIGPLNRAYGLLELTRVAKLGMKKSLLDEVQRLDPGNPYGLGRIASWLLSRAERRYQQPQEVDRLLREAARTAEKGLDVFQRRGYLKIRTMHWIKRELLQEMVGAYTMQGDSERVDQILADLGEDDYPLRATLDRARRQGEQRRQVLRDKILNRPSKRKKKKRN